MGIVVIGDVFIDIKGYSTSPYIPQGRNAGTILQIHGGVGRNVVEDIANVELEPTFVGLVDNDAMGEDVIQKLKRHKVDTRYMRKVKDGMGTWLAVFDHEGDVVGSISKRPDHAPIERILDEQGDEIFRDADSIVIEIDLDTVEEDTVVSLAFDKERLYKNMVAAKADWLYELPQWKEIFSEEELKKFYKEQKESTTIRKPKKIGRNDPCPCGSGKKYKKCCGR